MGGLLDSRGDLLMGDGMSPAKVATVLLIAGSLGACAATPETGQGAKENTGTAVGAIAGGLLGSTIGGNVATKLAAGVAGAAIGGLIGNRIGASMDEEDKRRAYAAQMQALESGRSGAPVTWKNLDTGRVTARSFRARPISRPAAPAGNTPTRSTSTDSRKPRVGPLAAIPMEPGPQSVDHPYGHHVAGGPVASDRGP